MAPTEVEPGPTSEELVITQRHHPSTSARSRAGGQPNGTSASRASASTASPDRQNLPTENGIVFREVCRRAARDVHFPRDDLGTMS